MAAISHPAGFDTYLDRARLTLGTTKARALSLSVGLLAALAGLVALARAVHGNPAWRTTTDFGNYLQSAAAIRHGTNPYAVWATTPDGIQHRVPYPPLFQEALVPLSLLGDSIARYAWMAISLACLIGAIVLLFRGFGRRIDYAYIVLACGALLLTFAVRDDLYHGQVNFLLLLLITAGAWFFVRDRPQGTGLMWGAALVVKPFLGVLLLYLLWKRAYRAAISMAVAGGALLAASFLVLLPRDSHVIGQWLTATHYDAMPPFTTQLDNYSLRGFLERSLTANPFAVSWTDSQLLLMAASAAVAVALTVVFVSSIQRTSPRLSEGHEAFALTEIALVLALGMAYGPLTEGDHVFLLVPGFVAVMLLAPQARGRLGLPHLALMLASWCLLAAFFASPILSLSGFNPTMAGSHPHGIGLLVTARAGVLLLVISIVTGLALRRLSATSRPGMRAAATIAPQTLRAAVAD